MTARHALRDLLPHRSPMLLLDEITTVEPGVRLVARRTIAADAPWCRTGLAPYLLLESWLQACAALACWEAPQPEGEVLVAGLRDVQAVRPARPGETVEHHVELVRRVTGSAICTGTGSIGGETVLSVGQVTIGFEDGRGR
ncbi:3-hydroxyacyl-ACP dehydratase FabZ family protein [Amycolatopsis sp. NPDC005003]